MWYQQKLNSGNLENTVTNFHEIRAKRALSALISSKPLHKHESWTTEIIVINNILGCVTPITSIWVHSVTWPASQDPQNGPLMWKVSMKVMLFPGTFHLRALPCEILTKQRQWRIMNCWRLWPRSNVFDTKSMIHSFFKNDTMHLRETLKRNAYGEGFLCFNFDFKFSSSNFF